MGVCPLAVELRMNDAMSNLTSCEGELTSWRPRKRDGGKIRFNSRFSTQEMFFPFQSPQIGNGSTAWVVTTTGECE